MPAAETTTPAPAPPRLADTLAAALADIKLAHSVFALPFALLGAVLAWSASSRGADATLAIQLALIVVAMFFARTWAMLFNRIADRAIDAANPRTARRALASGRVSLRAGWALALASALGFIATCAAFLALNNPWPIALSLPVLAWIALYSLTKRFTWLCHLFLGGALAASPLAAAIAIHPDTLLDQGPTQQGLLLIAAFVALWVGGFDIAYALQDLDYDRTVGLSSIPARFGLSGALWISRAAHALALVALWCAWALLPDLALIGAIGCALASALVLMEHAVLAKRGLAGLPIAFFTLNGILSLTLAGLWILDIAR